MTIKPLTLVLGGLGVKGVTSIGILQALHTYKIEVKKIYAAGTSALVAGHYALGRDPSELTDLFVQFFINNHDSLWGMEQISGLFRTQKRNIIDSFSYFLHERLYCRANLKRMSILSWDMIDPLLTAIFDDLTFSDLKIPLSISTVDLNTKKAFIVNSGKLSEALKAGIAFPGLFPPVKLDEKQLVSSTICCELPLETVKKSDSPVLAIDFAMTPTQQRPNNLLEIISRTTEIRSQSIKHSLLEKVDYTINLKSINQYRWGSYRRIPDMIRYAREEAKKQLSIISESQYRTKPTILAKG